MRGPTATALDATETKRRLSIEALCHRYYWPAAALILVLAAFNVSHRLDREIVTEWDEALYATNAWEMAHSDDWLRPTYLGAVDYYNSKPPLFVWLLALSLRTFGESLVAMRLPSAIAAWLTVLLLQEWTRRTLGRPVALMSSIVLATTFGFFYVHSGRSCNPDALFALLILLTVIVLFAAEERPWQRVWLGPLLAALFLLRGMGVLMPLAIVGVVEGWRLRSSRRGLLPLSVAAVIAALPVSAWVIARWRVDRSRFLQRIFIDDLVTRASTAIEGHSGTLLYYLNTLQKDQYDWLLAAIWAAVLFPISWVQLRALFSFRRGADPLRVVLVAWATILLLIPTAMRTKVAWYLNPFFPAFAVIVAVVVVHGLTQPAFATIRRRHAVVAGLLLAFGVAEGKLLYYSWHMRDLPSSVQGLMLSEKQHLAGRRVFCERGNIADTFVRRALVGAIADSCAELADCLRRSQPGDYVIAKASVVRPDLALVRDHGSERLYQRLSVP